MAFSLRRPTRTGALPNAVRTTLQDRTREKVLAWGFDDLTGEVIVAGAHHVFTLMPTGELVLDRPWHLVDGGLWDADEEALTVTWVDGAPSTRWVFRDGATFVPETLRERVQASVVLAETLRLGGRRTARVVIRRNLGTGDLVAQTLLGPGARAADPEVQLVTAEAIARLKEQVGLT